MARELVESYYRAFNARDYNTMLSLLTDDVVHDINQGGRERGRAAFAEFLQRMDESYNEQLVDIVIMQDAAGTRFAAEFIVVGKYLKGDAGFPEARGQLYRLPAASLLEIRDGKIARVTTYYNLQEWIAQVEGAP